MDAMPFGLIAALVGLLGGLVLGLAARLGDFCTLGALESAIYGRDQSRMRLWGIVLGVAILGTQTGVILGWIDLGSSMYQAISWNPVASVAGGLIFGYGMAMAGNCGFGALARLGGGDLRGLLVVLVMGLSAYVALSGPLAFWVCGLLLCLFVGPTQSAARTQLLRMTGEGKEGVAFGLYTMTGRAVAFLAPWLFFVFVDFFHADRAGSGGLCLVLVAGLIGMLFVRVPKAGEPAPG